MAGESSTAIPAKVWLRLNRSKQALDIRYQEPREDDYVQSDVLVQYEGEQVVGMTVLQLADIVLPRS